MNVLVTGGGTLAPIDDVRSIVNTSTGLFSSQLTEAFAERGARVWHLCTQRALRPFERLAAFDLDTADPAFEHARLDSLQQRWLAVRDRLTLRLLASSTVNEYASAAREIVTQHEMDIIVLAMAVSDFEPTPAPGKIDSAQQELTIVCRRAPKVINQIRAWAPRACLVGFKLLSGVPTEELVAAARKSLRNTGADLVVANDLKLVHTPKHVIHLVDSGPHAETIGPTNDLASQLVQRILQRHAAQQLG